VAWLPEIASPVTIDEVTWGSVVVVGDDRGARPSASVLTDHVTVIVGPEGDFSDREKAVLASLEQTHRWAIGSTRLRAETAAIALVSTVVALR
jgi:16S rRNA (uracil1498-N3)-methyltransferase